MFSPKKWEQFSAKDLDLVQLCLRDKLGEMVTDLGPLQHPKHYLQKMLQ